MPVLPDLGLPELFGMGVDDAVLLDEAIEEHERHSQLQLHLDDETDRPQGRVIPKPEATDQLLESRQDCKTGVELSQMRG